ncbi:MAG TPA: hypothetical protein VH413_04245 [Verrucomicrobiae bacterium]|jgi:hypothetical protein|nr:hypothetical protein [Verrucomicrobiae bacterium]
MVPLWWNHKVPIRNLPELLQLYHQHGGSIVQYRRIYSVILFSHTSSVFEWVPPTTSHRAAGRKHALWCFMFGWWSIPGLVGTPIALYKNLFGGMDVTSFLTAPPPIVQGQNP